MSTDTTALTRRSLAARVVTALDLPGSVSGDRPRLDKYRLSGDPALLRDLAALVADQLPPGTAALAGIELGGVPLATAMALHTGLPWTLIRRSPGAGTAGSPLAGSPVAGRATVVVKDMAQSGAAISAAAAVLRGSGARVTHAVVGVNWNAGLGEVLRPLGITPITGLDLADLRGGWRSTGRRPGVADTPGGTMGPESEEEPL